MRLWPRTAWALVVLWLSMRAAHDDVVPYPGPWPPYVAIAVAVLNLVGVLHGVDDPPDRDSTGPGRQSARDAAGEHRARVSR